MMITKIMITMRTNAYIIPPLYTVCCAVTNVPLCYLLKSPNRETQPQPPTPDYTSSPIYKPLLLTKRIFQ